MEEKKRIVWLDELRGLLVIGMVFHHFCYTLGYLFDVEVGRRIFVGFGPLHPLGAGLFILICGFCCHLSHSNVRRGLLLLGAATAMSLFLWIFMPENRIWFGILQLLAVCILLYAAGSRALAHVPLWCGVAVCAVLLVLTWHLPPEEAGRWSPGGGFFGIAGLWEVPLPEAVMQQKLLFPLGLARGYSAVSLDVCVFCGDLPGETRTEGSGLGLPRAPAVPEHGRAACAVDLPAASAGDLRPVLGGGAAVWLKKTRTAEQCSESFYTLFTIAVRNTITMYK